MSSDMGSVPDPKMTQ